MIKREDGEEPKWKDLSKDNAIEWNKHQRYMRNRRRYWLINSLTKNLSFSKTKARMQNEYRNEFAREVNPVRRSGDQEEKDEDRTNEDAFYAMHEQLTLQSISHALKSYDEAKRDHCVRALLNTCDVLFREKNPTKTTRSN